MIAVLIAAALLGGWEVYVRRGGVDPLILPAPSQIAEALVDQRVRLLDNLWVTGEVVLGGIVIAVVAAIVCAVTLHLWPPVRRGVYPLLIASQAVPIVVIAPLLTVWFGYDAGPKVAIVALVSFFPIVVVTLDGLRTVDPDIHRFMASLQATPWQRLRFVEFPTALPAAISGAKVAVAVAVIGAVFAEYAGSQAGLGHMILQAIPQLETARAWAAVVVLAALAVALVSLLTGIERLLAHYTQPQGTS